MDVLCGEAFVQTAEGHAYACCHAVIGLGQDLSLVAPWQKLGIGRHIHNQIEHFTGTEPDQHRLLDGFHRMQFMPHWRYGQL